MKSHLVAQFWRSWQASSDARSNAVLTRIATGGTATAASRDPDDKNDDDDDDMRGKHVHVMKCYLTPANSLTADYIYPNFYKASNVIYYIYIYIVHSNIRIQM